MGTGAARPQAGAAVIAVVGPGTATAAQEAQAAEVGRLLARAGATVVCGGLGGVMAAACRGAREHGGRTIGLLPGLDRHEGNPYLDVAIPTGLGEARNVLVVRASDALIAVGGEYGTLSEIAFALKTGVGVVGLGTWRLLRDSGPDTGIEAVADPGAAVRAALARVRY